MNSNLHLENNMDIINEYHKAHRVDERCEYMRGDLRRSPIPAIECNDGFHISVQASEYSYCSPRLTADIEYSQFECGFPSAPVPEIAEWKDGEKEDRETDTESVYGYVPVSAIVKLIEAHGGIKGPFKRENVQS